MPKQRQDDRALIAHGGDFEKRMARKQYKKGWAAVAWEGRQPWRGARTEGSGLARYAIPR